MEGIVDKIHSLLLKKGKTLAIAESCTGGLLSSLIMRNPGSSKYFILGVIAYSNKAKVLLVRVPNGLIAKKGAVSAEVALKLAQNIRKIARADLGIGVTGIAGPTGATTGKPVGTVYIAIASNKRSTCKKFIFSGSRLAIQNKSALKALRLLRNYLI